MLLQKYALPLAESSIYTTNLYHGTPPICIAILLQKYWDQGSLEHPQCFVLRKTSKITPDKASFLLQAMPWPLHTNSSICACSAVEAMAKSLLPPSASMCSSSSASSCCMKWPPQRTFTGKDLNFIRHFLRQQRGQNGQSKRLSWKVR